MLYVREFSFKLYNVHSIDNIFVVSLSEVLYMLHFLSPSILR